jgi:hypothetical protein
MPTPGLLWVTTAISKPSAISPTNFKKWYEEIHIPDLLLTSGISSAFRYQNVDENATPPYLAMYPVKDVDWLTSEGFQNVPRTHELFQVRGNSARECLDMDIRHYELVQEFKGEGATPGELTSRGSEIACPTDGNRTREDSYFSGAITCRGK